MLSYHQSSSRCNRRSAPKGSVEAGEAAFVRSCSPGAAMKLTSGPFIWETAADNIQIINLSVRPLPATQRVSLKLSLAQVESRHVPFPPPSPSRRCENTGQFSSTSRLDLMEYLEGRGRGRKGLAKHHRSWNEQEGMCSMCFLHMWKTACPTSCKIACLFCCCCHVLEFTRLL